VWARQIRAVAQTGLHFSKDPFDRERYDKLAALADEIMDHHTPDLDTATVQRIFADEDGYATPKVDTRGAVFNGAGEVLLVRENLDGGRWALPGGWADVNVPPSANTEREVLEEAGYRVKAVKLMACYDRDVQGHPPYIYHVYKLFFICELLSDTPVPSPQGDLETSEARWFAQDNLPTAGALSSGRVTSRQLLRCFAHYQNPALPTEFD